MRYVSSAKHSQCKLDVKPGLSTSTDNTQWAGVGSSKNRSNTWGTDMNKYRHKEKMRQNFLRSNTSLDVFIYKKSFVLKSSNFDKYATICIHQQIV